MALNIQLESLGKTLLVVPTGRLDFGSAPAFQTQFETALADFRGGGVIIDCSKLDYVSSAGLRVILLVSRAAKRAAVVLALCSLQPAVREVFDISGFTQVITVRDDRAAAMAEMPA